MTSVSGSSDIKKTELKDQSGPTSGGQDDIDLNDLFKAIGRRKKLILGTTLLAFLGSLAFVNLVSPKYTAEAKLLLENQDSYYSRPDKDSRSSDPMIDADDVLSQVQVAQSRDVARAVVKKLNLTSMPDFDPVLKGVPSYMRVLVMLGLSRDPTTVTPEDRVLESYANKVNIFPVGKSKVISAEVSTQDPIVAAKIANTIMEEYLTRQASAKKKSTQVASTWLNQTLEPLRQKLTEAEGKVEAFRSRNNLFLATDTSTIATQQLSELNTQLSTARATQAEQQSRARLIRQALQSGRIFDVSEVIKDDLIKKLSENRSTLRAMMASEERVYLPQHPRIKELAAQISDLEGQIRSAAERTARSLDNDARAASARVAAMQAEIDSQKKLVGQASEDDVQLKVLEREAKTLREQVEAYSAKANEANARDASNPASADARIVTIALPPSVPSFPKVLPIIAISTIAGLILSIIYTAASQLLRSPVRQLPLPAPPSVTETTSANTEAVSNPAGSGALATLMAANDSFSGLPPKGEGSELLPPEPPTAPEMPKINAASFKTPLMKTVLEPESTYAGGIAALISRIRALPNSGSGTIIQFHGSKSGIGTTSTALAVARQLSRNASVIVLDLNDKNAALGNFTDLPDPEGISDIISGDIEIAEAIHRDRASSAHLMPIGFSELDVCNAMLLPAILQALCKSYAYVLVDCGVVKNVPADISGRADFAILIAEGDKSSPLIRQHHDYILETGVSEVTIFLTDGSPAAKSANSNRPDQNTLASIS